MVTTPNAPSISKVLVVWKLTFQMEIEEGDDDRLKELISSEDESMARTMISHKEHLATVARVEEILAGRGLEFQSFRRDKLDVDPNNFDLIIAVGGDGTLLDISHKVDSPVPVLAVNSAKSTSFGHYALADIETFAEVFDSILDGAREPVELTRLQVEIDGEPIPTLALNEVFITHSNPAATSRYCIHIGDDSEQHMSSGLLVGTPTGSTGWLRSAAGDLLGFDGGMVMPVTSRRYAYFVREPFTRPGEKLAMRHGFVEPDVDMRIVSLMLEGRIYIDGSYLYFDFPRSRELVIKPSDKPLRAFVDPEVNDRYVLKQ